MTERPSEALHLRIADLISSKSRPASEVGWDEVEKFIAPVLSYLEDLIRCEDPDGLCFIVSTTDGNAMMVLNDDWGTVWESPPCPYDDLSEREEDEEEEQPRPVKGCIIYDSILKCEPNDSCHWPDCRDQIPPLAPGEKWNKDEKGWRASPSRMEKEE